MVTSATQASDKSLLSLQQKETCAVGTLNNIFPDMNVKEISRSKFDVQTLLVQDGQTERTSKTPERRSATFGVQGLGLFPLFFLFFCFFFELHCCTISCSICCSKKIVKLSRGVTSCRPLLLFFFFFQKRMFFDLLILFLKNFLIVFFFQKKTFFDFFILLFFVFLFFHAFWTFLFFV